MRFGAEVTPVDEDPEAWAAELRRLGYDATIWPLEDGTPTGVEDAFAAAAARAGVQIAEVGAWCNPLHPDATLRREKLERCRRRLALAERLGARCCVNVVGSRGPDWLAPHPDNYAEDTFDLAVESIRAIVDAVRPTRTRYAVETMPWMLPDSPEDYARLLAAVDRSACAVHLDPANLVNQPRLAARSGELLDRCFDLLGPQILSCHAKDVRLEPDLTVCLREVPPGDGQLDYRTFLRRLARLDPETSLLLEHFGPAELARGAAHIRELGEELGIPVGRPA